MKRILPVFFIVLWVIFSGMAGTPATDVPVPAVNFRATVIDDQDIATKCANVSWEGKTFFRAERGRGVITIPFEKVKKVTRVADAGGGGVDAQVVLKSGETVAVTFDGEARFFGQTTFGTYRISAKNIKEIFFE